MGRAKTGDKLEVWHIEDANVDVESEAETQSSDSDHEESDVSTCVETDTVAHNRTDTVPTCGEPDNDAHNGTDVVASPKPDPVTPSKHITDKYNMKQLAASTEEVRSYLRIEDEKGDFGKCNGSAKKRELNSVLQWLYDGESADTADYSGFKFLDSEYEVLNSSERSSPTLEDGVSGWEKTMQSEFDDSIVDTDNEDELNSSNANSSICQLLTEVRVPFDQLEPQNGQLPTTSKANEDACNGQLPIISKAVEDKMRSYTVNASYINAHSTCFWHLFLSRNYQRAVWKNQNPIGFDRLARLIEILDDVSEHPNMVSLLAYRLLTSGPHHKVEFLFEGSAFQTLSSCIAHSEHKRLTNSLALFRQLIDGIEYLHLNGICHGTLNSQNIYLNNCGRLKIGNLKHAARFHDNGHILKKLYNELDYLAPEAINGDYRGDRADLYACGIILEYMRTGQLPKKESFTTILFHPLVYLEETEKHDICLLG